MRRGSKGGMAVVGMAWLAACGVDMLSAPASSDPHLLAVSARATSAALTSQAVRFDSIALAWVDASTSEDGWEIHRSTTGPTGSFNDLTYVGANTTTYRQGSLAPLTQYCYKVRAYRQMPRKLVFDAFTNVSCSTTPAMPLPSSPEGLNAVPGSSTKANVRWGSGGEYVESYRLERSLDAGASWTTAATTSPQQRYATDSGRTAEVAVCYRVFAVNRGGVSAASNVDCTTPPAAPSQLTWTMRDDGMVEMTWADNSQVEDSYEVWFYVEGGYPFFWTVEANATLIGYDPASIWFDYMFARSDGGISDVVTGAPFATGGGSAPAGTSRSTSSSRPVGRRAMGKPR